MFGLLKLPLLEHSFCETKTDTCRSSYWLWSKNWLPSQFVCFEVSWRLYIPVKVKFAVGIVCHAVLSKCMNSWPHFILVVCGFYSFWVSFFYNSYPGPLVSLGVTQFLTLPRPHMSSALLQVLHTHTTHLAAPPSQLRDGEWQIQNWLRSGDMDGRGG